jgi:hypothetical protein
VTAVPRKPENPFINIVCNIVLPSIVLMKFSTDKWLGPLWGLIIALIFPVGYGIYDLATRKKTNVLSILGFISVLLSGGLALAKIGSTGFAFKEAALPTVIGIAVLVSLRTKRPLVREMLYNESLIDVPRVDAALAARGEQAHFEERLQHASVWLAVTFLASAPVNYFLALYVLTAPPGTAEFNDQLARMNWVSLIVIALPSMGAMMIVFYKLMNGLAELSGLTQEEIFREQKKS